MPPPITKSPALPCPHLTSPEAPLWACFAARQMKLHKEDVRLQLLEDNISSHENSSNKFKSPEFDLTERAQCVPGLAPAVTLLCC